MGDIDGRGHRGLLVLSNPPSTS